MYYIIVYTTVTTLVVGVTTFLYKYLTEYLQSNKKLSITEFDVNSVVPDDINLSNNVPCPSLTIDKTILQNKENTDITFITTVIDEYNKLNKDLTSDFVVDIFTNKTDNQNKFSVTKLVTTTTTSKVALYLGGNNDYFYNAKLAYSLNKKGYNFYAISFPNHGFTCRSKCPEFSSFNNIEFLFQYIEIVLEYYKIKQIDLLLGYSTGGLISIMYANYKNSKSQFIKRCILSSPFIDLFADPNNTSFTGSEAFIEEVVTPLGLVLPKIKIMPGVGIPNTTTCQEFNEINFNPKYKSLITINTYPEWIRACTIAQQQIQNSKIDMKCPVDILHSDKSVFWDYTENADNILDINDITKYGSLISSSDITFHKITNSIHNCFLRVNIEEYLD